MCRQYRLNDVVCPSHLQKGHFITGAMGNIDHNPSSTTADSSFHGIGISIVEYHSEGTDTIVEDGINLLQTLLMSFLFQLLPIP